MSSNPVQSRPLERVASRRNVIRSAAWTTAAVTVVVATPNIAAASSHGGLTPSASMSGTRTGTDYDNYSLSAHVHGAAQSLPGLTVTLSVSNGNVAWPQTVTGGWTRSGTSNSPTPSRVYTYNAGNLGPNGTATIGLATFLNNSNTKTMTLTANFMWTGGATSASVVLTRP